MTISLDQKRLKGNADFWLLVPTERLTFSPIASSCEHTMPSVASIGTNDDQQDDVTNNTTVHSSRVVVVTGAAQGIGREIALRLARDGLDVALNDVPNNLGKLEAVREAILEQGKETGNGRRCILIPGDVSKEKEVSAMIEEVVNELGGLDVVSRISNPIC